MRLPSRVLSAGLVAALLAAYFFLAASAAATKSHTFDEIAHITAGYATWRFDDHRLMPENGSLPQRLAGLPAVIAGATFPPMEDPDWRRSDVYALGRTFFFESGNDVSRLVANGRAMIALLGVSLGAIVFVFSRRLNGLEGGFISLILFVLCPTLLAHGALATSDMAAALAFTASVGSMWLVLQAVTPIRMLASAAAAAGVFLSKFSAPVILPMALAVAMIRLASREPLQVGAGRWSGIVRRGSGQAAVLLVVGALHAILVYSAIWAAYSFRYEAFHPPGQSGEQFLVDWPMLFSGADGSSESRAGAVLRWCREHRVLPEAYIYGFAHTLRFAESRRAFMNGEHSLTGWRTFFPYAFAVKTALPLLLILPVAAGGWLVARDAQVRGISRRPRVPWEATPWIVLLAVYWIFAVTTNLNIGHRHLLPVYPALLILAGGAGAWIRRARETWTAPAVVPAAKRKARARRQARSRSLRPYAGAAAVALLVAWQAVESFAVRPHYLAYFNQLAGGPDEGYKRLVDSSLDWGQDLPALRDWLDEHVPPGSGRPPVYLSYFGTSSPAHYGIDAVLLESYLELRSSRTPAVLQAGYYCVSATMLQGVYLAVNGAWTAKNEQTYRMMSTLVRARAKAGSDEERGRLDAMAGAQRPGFWTDALRLYDELRTARLMGYLRRREPTAMAGYSILIYRLSDADLKAALEGPPIYD